MSASSLALWNALPLQPVEENSLKRTRSEFEQYNDDDDVSIVSRSPSPPPENAMDIDEDSLSKYDEYIHKPEREVITVDTKIKPTNKGFAMLSKLGWIEGQPLGLSGDGRIDPIPFQVKSDFTGLGKTTQDARMIETTVSQRRELDSERQQKETDEQRRAREELVARRSALESEISSTLKAFYCTLCDKQFKNVAQYDEHTNSYAHHHKARFKDMQANARIIPKEEIDKRKEKERKREEKELRKIAAAAGIKMTKSSASVALPTSTPVDALPNTSSGEGEVKPMGFKKSGWATISSAPVSSQRKSGWDAVGHSSTPQPAAPPPPEPPQPAPLPYLPDSSQVRLSSYPAPTFRTGGWTSLDTGPSQTITSPSALMSQPTATPNSGNWSTLSPAPPLQNPTQPSPLHQVSASQPAHTPVQSRSSWQQFQKSAPRRR